VLSWLILKVVDLMVGVRVGPDQETEGLDIVLHEESGYNL
jgi:Amt family ammonium transporter